MAFVHQTFYDVCGHTTFDYSVASLSDSSFLVVNSACSPTCPTTISSALRADIIEKISRHAIACLAAASNQAPSPGETVHLEAGMLGGAFGNMFSGTFGPSRIFGYGYNPTVPGAYPPSHSPPRTPSKGGNRRGGRKPPSTAANTNASPTSSPGATSTAAATPNPKPSPSTRNRRHTGLAASVFAASEDGSPSKAAAEPTTPVANTTKLSLTLNPKADAFTIPSLQAVESAPAATGPMIATEESLTGEVVVEEEL